MVPPPGYWPGCAGVCGGYGVVLIADEVMAGFGRLAGSRSPFSTFDVVRFDDVAGSVTYGCVPLGRITINS